jgi:hypothetical protein
MSVFTNYDDVPLSRIALSIDAETCIACAMESGAVACEIMAIELQLARPW